MASVVGALNLLMSDQPICTGSQGGTGRDELHVQNLLGAGVGYGVRFANAGQDRCDLRIKQRQNVQHKSRGNAGGNPFSVSASFHFGF